MNNKILARIVAAVMAIAMLGSLSFAASLTGDTLNLSDVPGKNAEYANNTKKTAIAFYATDSGLTAPVNADDIIAIAQVEDGNIATSFPIDTTRAAAEDEKFVVVRYGGDAGKIATASIALSGTETSVTPLSTYTIDGVTYSNVAYFENSVTPGAGNKLGSYGFKIKNNNGTNKKYIYFTADTLIEGDANWKYGVLFVGIEGTPSWTAYGYHTVVPAE